MRNRAIACVFLCLALVLASCGAGKTAVTLTDDEKDLIQELGSDLNVVARNGFAEVIGDFEAHVGQMYQLEGEFTRVDINGAKAPYLYQDVNGQRVGVQMDNLQKEIGDGAWIRATGLISEMEIGGQHQAVFIVYAVESVDN